MAVADSDADGVITDTLASNSAPALAVRWVFGNEVSWLNPIAGRRAAASSVSEMGLGARPTTATNVTDNEVVFHEVMGSLTPESFTTSDVHASGPFEHRCAIAAAGNERGIVYRGDDSRGPD